LDISKSILTGLTCLLLAMPVMAQEVDTKQPWFPSKYGADDTIGAANHLSTEIVKHAAQLITTGKVYQLGVVTHENTPAYGGRKFQMLLLPQGSEINPGLGRWKGTFHDDVLISSLGMGSQIDGLGHYGLDNVYYNGIPSDDIYGRNGAKKFGTHEIPPIVTRGVLLDMVRYFKEEEMVPAGTPFGAKEIKEAAELQGIEIQKGDVVLFHTGWLKMASEDPKVFLAGEPGPDRGGAEYLASLNVVAVGSDTAALDVSPVENPDDISAAHGVLIAKNGIYLLENVQTAELAADEAHLFLFVLGIPRFKGAVQMVINPIAIR